MKVSMRTCVVPSSKYPTPTTWILPAVNVPELTAFAEADELELPTFLNSSNSDVALELVCVAVITAPSNELAS